MLVVKSASGFSQKPYTQKQNLFFNESATAEHIADVAPAFCSMASSQNPVNLSKISFRGSLTKSCPVKCISFTGKNTNQVAIVGAELPPYAKVGGVATVMKDYMSLFTGVKGFIPYYNGKIQYDSEGNPTGSVSVLTKDNKPIFTNADLTTKSVEDLGSADYHELEEVARKKMSWAGREEEVVLYRVPNTEHYMVYTDVTARMAKPYAVVNGGYTTAATNKVLVSTSNNGDPYAKFNKAQVELLPELERAGFNPAHILCSDAQTAYIPEFMAEKAISGHPYYKGAEVKPSYIMHNVGAGYQGETSAQNMFFNLADKKLIEAVDNDPNYITALKAGKKEDYFRQFFPTLIDAKGTVNASMLPINYAKSGYITHIDTVSEFYATDVAKDPKIAPGLTTDLKGLEDQKKFGGILNGFSDYSFNPDELIGLEYYKTACTDPLTGITHQPFRTFNAGMPIDEIMKIKNENARNLFQRLKAGADPKFAIGKESTTKIIGAIDDKWVKHIDNGGNIDLFVSWGRGDFQKGLDNVLHAFETFAQLPEGQNAILVLGGELRDGDQESNYIKQKMKSLTSKRNPLKGRIVFLDGFAPNKVLSSAGKSAVFASRFAPCELTDIEAMKYGCTPIVTNTQGLAQKNNEISSGLDKATSYKTSSPFYMDREVLEAKSEKFKLKVENLIEVERQKLEIKGVTANLQELATKNVLSSSGYKELCRLCSDEVLVHEFIDAMKAKVSETPEVRARLVKNAMNIKSAWHENNALHPSGLSSKEMYYDLHINAQATQPTSVMLQVPEDFWKRINAINLESNQRATQIEVTATNTAKKLSKSKLANIAAAIAAVGLGIMYYIKSNQTNTSADIFQKQAVASNSQVQFPNINTYQKPQVKTS